MSVQRVSHGEQMPSRTEAGMRVGLVGVGRIGVLHAETLADNPQVSQLRIADADPARAREVAGKVGAAVTGAHAELVQRGAEAGLPVFCEKPLAADVAGTRRVLARVAAAGTSLQVGFQRRFDHGYRAAREAVRSGSLGWLHTLRATTADPAPPPEAYIRTSGGIYRDCHIHDFDIIRFVTGREVETVYATGANRGDGFFARAGDVDTSAVLLTLDDGTLGVVSGGRYNGGGYDARLEVAGSEGTVVAGLDERAPLRSAEQGVSWPPGQPYASFYERFRRAYVAELGEFLDHVLGRIPNPCPAEEALEALYVAEAAERSRAEDRPVHVGEVR